MVERRLHIPVHIVHHNPSHTEPQPHLPLFLMLALDRRGRSQPDRAPTGLPGSVGTVGYLGNSVEHISILRQFLGLLRRERNVRRGRGEGRAGEGGEKARREGRAGEGGEREGRG